jgi:anti-sigma factor RsiW
MNDCASAEMRDALPDLIHGLLDEVRAAEVTAHVAACAECAADVALLRAIVASAPAAPAIDVERIVRALPRPTRQGFMLHRGGENVASPASARPRRIWDRSLLRVAAAVAVVTAGGLSLVVGRDVMNPERQISHSVTRSPAAKPTAQGARSAPAAAVPNTATTAVPVRHVASVNADGLSLVGETHELSDAHLATLLSEMDRLDAIPEAEPETVTPVVGDSNVSGELQ